MRGTRSSTWEYTRKMSVTCARHCRYHHPSPLYISHVVTLTFCIADASPRQKLHLCCLLALYLTSCCPLMHGYGNHHQSCFRGAACLGYSGNVLMLACLKRFSVISSPIYYKLDTRRSMQPCPHAALPSIASTCASLACALCKHRSNSHDVNLFSKCSGYL